MAFFAVTINLHGVSFCLGLVTTALFIITGGVTSIVHSLQVNPKYPFRVLGNDWKWFYPNIVDERYKPTRIVKETEKEYLQKRLLHVEGLKEYARKIVNQDKVERLKVDIQQLYLLHVNEKYKNHFLTSLRRILTWGLLITSIVLISLLIAIAAEQIKSSAQTNKARQTEQSESVTGKEKSVIERIKGSPQQRELEAQKTKTSPISPMK
jgi:hypothetical protein